MTIKLSLFYLVDAVVWYNLVEQQFEISKISTEKKRFYHILASLSPQVTKLVSDILTVSGTTRSDTRLKKP